ncbi:MAG: SRPBCC family protein [Candidatus Eremiobacteraeota bacterium]|nr:SRPBCC family protein [Candidatus Eremiobacteraeota bacterium]
MTHTENAIEIAAPASRIFALAADTARWPEFLPHYRYVRTLREDGDGKTLAMGAWRDFIPVSWVARQWNDERTPSIRFHHVRGWTRGMDVEWKFERTAAGTRVSIVHDLEFAFPVARDFLGKHVVGEFFVRAIAAKTLRCIKALAERA